MPRTTLADVASDYVRKHQHERQCRQLDSNSRVTLTVIQNQWAKLAGQEPMTIFDAPEVVIRSIETTQRGHELFALNMNDLTSALRVNWKQCLPPVLLETAI